MAEDKETMPKCASHTRKEHTVRVAIRKIILDMLLANNKMNSFMNKKKSTRPEVSVYYNRL